MTGIRGRIPSFANNRHCITSLKGYQMLLLTGLALALLRAWMLYHLTYYAPP